MVEVAGDGNCGFRSAYDFYREGSLQEGKIPEAYRSWLQKITSKIQTGLKTDLSNQDTRIFALNQIRSDLLNVERGVDQFKDKLEGLIPSDERVNFMQLPLPEKLDTIYNRQLGQLRSRPLLETSLKTAWQDQLKKSWTKTLDFITLDRTSENFEIKPVELEASPTNIIRRLASEGVLADNLGTLPRNQRIALLEAAEKNLMNSFQSANHNQARLLGRQLEDLYDLKKTEYFDLLTTYPNLLQARKDGGIELTPNGQRQLENYRTRERELIRTRDASRDGASKAQVSRELEELRSGNEIYKLNNKIKGMPDTANNLARDVSKWLMDYSSNGTLGDFNLSRFARETNQDVYIIASKHDRATDLTTLTVNKFESNGDQSQLWSGVNLNGNFIDPQPLPQIPRGKLILLQTGMHFNRGVLE